MKTYATSNELETYMVFVFSFQSTTCQVLGLDKLYEESPTALAKVSKPW